jgi:transcription elongation factor
MTQTFQPGDRIEMYPGESHSYRADVLQVAKNGSVRIERWWQHMNVGEPELRREWLPAYIVKNATLIRRGV